MTDEAANNPLITSNTPIRVWDGNATVWDGNATVWDGNATTDLAAPVPQEQMRQEFADLLKVFADFVNGCAIVKPTKYLPDGHNFALAIAATQILDPNDNGVLIEAIQKTVAASANTRVHKLTEVIQTIPHDKCARSDECSGLRYVANGVIYGDCKRCRLEQALSAPSTPERRESEDLAADQFQEGNTMGK